MTSAELKYLTTINELYNGLSGIKLTTIATKMNVTKVSVYRVVERLQNHGYIKRDEKNKVIMTAYGYEQLEKFNLIINWISSHLQKICKVDSAIIHNDAIGVVCTFSDETRDALVEFICLHLQKEK